MKLLRPVMRRLFGDVNELLKETTSRCPVCHRSCKAEVRKMGRYPSKVFMIRNCPEHGESSFCISSDARFYWLSKGRQEEQICCSGGGCCPSADGNNSGTLGGNVKGRGDKPFEVLSTCLALIEIVNSCNLACPTCFADSPVGATGHGLDAVPLSNLKERIHGVIDRKGRIEILQLSGGEPTLHPQLFELLYWIADNPNIDYIVLNTNGIRLAKDARFLEDFRRFLEKSDDIQLYLQFDGPQEEGQLQLRGIDLRETRKKAIENCGQIGLPVNLAMTVTRENIAHVFEATEFALQFDHMRGISFQPMFQSGRIPADTLSGGKAEDPLNVADIILALAEQSKDLLGMKTFTPLPCGDPNCATIGYLIRKDGNIRSVGDFIDFRKMQGFLKDKLTYSLEDLAKCGCEEQPLAELMKKFELEEKDAFRIVIKPFMDARSWDDHRIDRCCTHVIRPDGKLDSFCRYYSGFPDVAVAP